MGGAGRSVGRRFTGGHRPLSVERAAKRVDHTPQQAIPNGHIHHPPGAHDPIAGMHIRIISEQHDADLALVYVEGNSEYIARKPQQFLETGARQARDRHDASGNVRDDTHLLWRKLRLEGFPHLGQPGEGIVKSTLQGFRSGVHWGAGTACLSSSSPTAFSIDAR